MRLVKYFCQNLLVLSALLGLAAGEKSAKDEDCFCSELKDEIDDCNCTVDAVEQLNRVRLYPLLTEIVHQNFFRFYKVNLKRKCPFWHPDHHCTLRDCHVEECDASELPAAFLEEANQLLAEAAESTEKSAEKSAEQDVKCEDGKLGMLDTTLSDESKKAFRRWSKHDYNNELNFCEYDDDVTKDHQYVDLLLNPERFTGYQGKSAWRIWKSIYEENCFNEHTNFPIDPNGMCLEERVFYRAISGLHASISLHLSYEYPLPQSVFAPSSVIESAAGSKKNGVVFGTNLCEFVERFSPQYTRDGPRRLKNLYFVYLLELRAFAKAAPYLKRHLSTLIFTGDAKRDAALHEDILTFLRFVLDFKHHFDETILFHDGDAAAERRKFEFREHFRNISHIMDCVACEKCRLWGKLQIQGLGTALKILFTDAVLEAEDETDPVTLQTVTEAEQSPKSPLEHHDDPETVAPAGQCSADRLDCSAPPNMYTTLAHSSQAARSTAYSTETPQVQFQLRRNEIVALFNAFRQLSKGLYVLDEFRHQLRHANLNQRCPNLRAGVH